MRELYIEERRVPVRMLEDAGDGFVRFEAVVSEADFINRNRRIYPESVLFPAFEQLNARLAERPGLVDHPVYSASVSDIGILWEGFHFEGKQVIGRGLIVPTAKGKDLAAVMQAGVAVGFSTRGYGVSEEIDYEGGKARRLVEFELEAVDAVVDPSVYHARVRSFTKEETERMENELKQAQEALAEANARVEALTSELANLRSDQDSAQATIAELRNQLAEAQERVKTLESELTEARREQAEMQLEARINELTVEHRFGATIRAKIKSLRESGVPVTLENVEALVGSLRELVEAAGAAANEEGTPRGVVGGYEEEGEVTEDNDGLTDEELESLRVMGLA